MSSGSLGVAGAASSSSATATEDDYHHLHHELALAASDLNIISIKDRKDQALLVLKTDLMEKLNKLVKSLDEDSWMFDGPRSRIHQISRKGGLQHRRTEISKDYNISNSKK